MTFRSLLSNLTIASPIASIPSVTASILHSLRVTLISINWSIALYIASTGPVPEEVDDSTLLVVLFLIFTKAVGFFSDPDSISTEINSKLFCLDQDFLFCKFRC